MASTTRELTLVGGDADVFQQVLEADPCYGQHYSATAPECQRCVTPVVQRGKLLLLREVCQAICRGGDAPAGTMIRLPAREVLARLQEGATLGDIFCEMLNGSGDTTKVRDVLRDRLWYLEKELGLPVPKMGSTADLIKEGECSK